MPPELTPRRSALARIERVVIGLLGAAALAIALLQVAGRYAAPAHAISWAEEAIVYLVVWAVMLAAGELVRTDGHVRSDVLLHLLGLRQRRALELFNCVVGIVFCVGLAWYGWQVFDTGWLLDERSSSGIEFPMWIYYLALPAGAASMAVAYVIRLVRFAWRYDPDRMNVGHVAAHEMPIDAPLDHDR
ncbi:TRAP transporter small permease [Methylobacterium sp. J-030]|uniref:TRAP transporter small permease n=1 Tax=Methylobacterium sp. J-030 TaxID=2836627 RepID=UPI001FBA98B8|nr:TRAP transporter small permease [Methylobacterium sp. J-030]MCJ2072426.1 TRAP transporter small permease [Methylobacterium sp. J-030]